MRRYLWSDYNPGNNMYYVGPVSAEQTGSSKFGQAVTIPITMSEPVLSFAHKLGDTSGSRGSWFEVVVNEGVTSTILLSTTENVDSWSHRWFDLSPWVGKGITLAFSVHQTAACPRAWAHVDEISVGSAHPDLWVRKDALTLAAMPGEQIAYSITYGNQGGAAANGVLITDTLPEELLFAGANPSPVFNTLIWAWEWDVGSVPAKSETFNIAVTATVAPTAALWSNLTNTVSIGTASSELEKSNNQTREVIFVGRRVYMPLILRDYTFAV